MHPVFLVTGVCWAVTYVLIIRRGFAERTYGMPIVALCTNLSWEFIYSFVRPHAGFQRAGDIVWVALDAVIMFTAVRFGPREFPYLSKPVFYAGLAGTLVLSYLGVDLMAREFEHGAGNYAGFADNLMMSALFLGMLAGRRGLRGQSVSIAAWKFVGTIFASLGFYLYGTHSHTALFVYMYFANGIADFAYLVAVVVIALHIRGRTRAGGGAIPAQAATDAVTVQ